MKRTDTSQFVLIDAQVIKSEDEVDTGETNHDQNFISNISCKETDLLVNL